MTELKDMKPVQLFVAFSKEMRLGTTPVATKASNSLSDGAAKFIMRADKKIFNELAIYLEKYVPIDEIGVKEGWLILLKDIRTRSAIAKFPMGDDLSDWIDWLRQHAE